MTNDMAGLFQVLYGKTDGTFRKAEVLKGTDGEPLIIPVHSKPGKGEDWINNICTRPFAADWDNDGDLDILSGSSEGGVQWAENRAGPGKPPRLEPFRKLIEHGPRVDYGSILRDADIK